jgi:hypothetical protein
LSTTKPQRQLALQLVGDADDGAFGDVRDGRQDLLHAAGRQPVAGDVDDVVGARHDEEVAVLVHVAGIGRLVVAGELVEIGAEALIGVPQRRQAARRQRQLDDDVAQRAGGTGWPASSRPARRSRASATVGEPILTGSCPRPSGLPAIAQPVSVCHQWSMTGTPSLSCAH